MRRLIQALLLLAICGIDLAHAVDLEIEVRGIKVRTGQVHAALFSNAEDFAIDLAVRAMITQEGRLSTGVFTREINMPRPPVETVSALANAKTLHLRMSDLLPGTYALALYQDVNDDGKLDTRMDGKPLEPWGLSNNPKLEGRDPTWDEVQFVLPPEGKTLVIDLQ